MTKLETGTDRRRRRKLDRYQVWFVPEGDGPDRAMNLPAENAQDAVDQVRKRLPGAVVTTVAMMRTDWS